MKNLDEMHFVINMDNGKTLGFHSDQEVKYANVASRQEATTMVVYIIRDKRAAIMPPIIIFTNQMQNYPICGMQNNIFSKHLFFLCMSCIFMLNICW